MDRIRRKIETVYPVNLQIWKMFTEWFTISYQSMVTDVISDEPLEHDE
jgi:hypothetical protein